jgi:hypothetical protein
VEGVWFKSYDGTPDILNENMSFSVPLGFGGIFCLHHQGKILTALYFEAEFTRMYSVTATSSCSVVIMMIIAEILSR